MYNLRVPLGGLRHSELVRTDGGLTTLHRRVPVAPLSRHRQRRRQILSWPTQVQRSGHHRHSTALLHTDPLRSYNGLERLIRNCCADNQVQRESMPLKRDRHPPSGRHQRPARLLRTGLHKSVRFQPRSGGHCLRPELPGAVGPYPPDGPRTDLRDWMEVRVPRKLLGLAPNSTLDIEFKWIDSVPASGDILGFYLHGDVAPDGRFNYRYCAP